MSDSNTSTLPITPSPPVELSPASPPKKPCCKPIIWLGIGVIIIVLIGGGLVFSKGKLNISPPNPSPVSLASVIPTPDLAAGWKTYINNNFGFSVKYDPAFIPDETVGSGQQLALITFSTMKNHGFDIDISTGDSIDYYKNQIIDHVTNKIDKEETISVDGVPAIKLTWKQIIVIDSIDVSRTIVNKNNRDYIITALSTDIDQILSTFKFLDINIDN